MAATNVMLSGGPWGGFVVGEWGDSDRLAVRKEGIDGRGFYRLVEADGQAVFSGMVPASFEGDVLELHDPEPPADETDPTPEVDPTEG